MYTFTLKNININSIVNTYFNNNSEEESRKCDIELNINENEHNIDRKYDSKNDDKTPLSELIKSDNNEFISFLNQIKHSVKCVQVKTELNDINNIPCFWCRHDFDSIPVSCPIKYIPNQVIKHYYSEISKSNYTIKEKAGSSSNKTYENKNLKLYKAGQYIVDGIFCSFNCCQSFIIENKHNNMYDDSELLLIQMYNDITDSNITKIDPSPHWRLLKDRGGGKLTIDEFRKNLGKIEYNYHNYVKSIYKPISYLWEEKIKLT